MAPDIAWILMQSELSNIRVTFTQMVGTTDFVSRPWKLFVNYHQFTTLTVPLDYDCAEPS